MNFFAIYRAFLLLVLTALLIPKHAAAQTVLENVRDRGYVKCAIGNRVVGDTRLGDSGYHGFFPEFCRVVALAIFGDRDAVQLSPMLIRHGLQSIQESDVDIYVSNVTWTLSRDFSLKLIPAAVLYYDGQGFMSHKGTISGALNRLKEAKVCVSRATTTIGNLKDYINFHNLNWEILPFESTEGRHDAFYSRKCDLMTADRLVLATTRSTAVENPKNYILHDEIISKEPLVAYVNTKDMVWANIVRWAIYATIFAEEEGITSKNYKDYLSNREPAIRRLLGLDPMKATLEAGLSQNWARNIIAEAGNYGEIFERYLGKHSEIKVKRGLNKLWRDGGLQYSPPFR